ncbi:family A G protein-coupled receptor-like protein [Sistotremastrum suecicum HHB10207 ss-3]|uniref:Family A G protein-coupled receptor-like protein n=1 Tax=Sistotremastrum suecicum HHB10207 ss-3 TaxID=1314776 RepID=A0A166G513_9AGAM|nr:family A G protein-coupled receptor-like protein [Sistotremastrum suecicum HHB10207 ss-3]
MDLAPVVLTINHAGSVALWTGFGVFTLSSALLFVLSFRAPAQRRTFFYFGLLINVLGALNYYKMASGDGSALVIQGLRKVSGHPEPVLVVREVFRQHYIDWSLATVLNMFQMGLLSGMSWVNIVLLLLTNEAVVQTGWVAAMESNQTRKYVWWAFSWLFLAAVAYLLLVVGKKDVKSQPIRVGALYNSLAFGAFILLAAYPVNLFFAEGLGISSVGVEQIAYSTFDILAKAGFGIILAAADILTDHEYTLATMPESWVEPRSKTGAVRLPGSDNL